MYVLLCDELNDHDLPTNSQKRVPCDWKMTASLLIFLKSACVIQPYLFALSFITIVHTNDSGWRCGYVKMWAFNIFINWNMIFHYRFSYNFFNFRNFSVIKLKIRCQNLVVSVPIFPSQIFPFVVVPCFSCCLNSVDGAAANFARPCSASWNARGTTAVWSESARMRGTKSCRRGRTAPKLAFIFRYFGFHKTLELQLSLKNNIFWA